MAAKAKRERESVQRGDDPATSAIQISCLAASLVVFGIRPIRSFLDIACPPVDSEKCLENTVLLQIREIVTELEADIGLF